MKGKRGLLGQKGLGIILKKNDLFNRRE